MKANFLYHLSLWLETRITARTRCWIMVSIQYFNASSSVEENSYFWPHLCQMYVFQKRNTLAEQVTVMVTNESGMVIPTEFRIVNSVVISDYGKFTLRSPALKSNASEMPAYLNYSRSGRDVHGLVQANWLISHLHSSRIGAGPNFRRMHSRRKRFGLNWKL